LIVNRKSKRKIEMSAFSQERLRPHPLSEEFSCLRLWIPDSDERVVVVAMDRIRKRNAISSVMWREIGRAFSVLGRTGDDCRAIILIGAGTKAFTAGIDITDESFGLAAESGGDESHDVARRGLAFYPQILDMQKCFTAVEECPVPVIAAIQGSCIGAGVDLASACDIRICSNTARFSVREVKIGLAADVGTLQRFPKITGNDSRVRELCLTGEVFSAHEALRIGFVSRISDRLMGDALKLATTIASNSPVAVVGTKRSLVYSRDHTVADGLIHVATHNTSALMTNDIPTAFLSAKQKKFPKFEKIPKLSKL
jgi:delta(3,5)-delta(2,4)-dienoyl-CoA isomerase